MKYLFLSLCQFAASRCALLVCIRRCVSVFLAEKWAHPPTLEAFERSGRFQGKLSRNDRVVSPLAEGNHPQRASLQDSEGFNSACEEVLKSKGGNPLGIPSVEWEY